MKPAPTINPKLDCEHMAAKFVDCRPQPVSLLEVRSYFYKLRPVTAETLADEVIDKVITKVTEESGILKDDQMEKFWKGKNSSLFQLLQNLFVILQGSVQDIALRRQQLVEQEMLKIASSPTPLKEAQRYMEIDGPVAKIESQELLDTQKQLIADFRLVESLIQSYGIGQNEKIPTRQTVPTYSKKYLRYLQILYKMLDRYAGTSDMAQVLFPIVVTLTDHFPKNEYDPFEIDSYNNLVELLCKPENYGNMYRKNKILSPEVARAFANLCPEYAFLSYEQAVEKVSDKTPYQKLITFTNDFSFGQGDLTNLHLNVLESGE